MAEKWLTALQSQIKKSTYCKYYIILNKYIFPEFGEKDINTISNLQLQFFCDNLLTNSESRPKPLSPKTVSDILSVIRGVLHYALRHTFATRCVEIGFDIKSLSEILGHASVNITMNRYVHPSMELKQQNMQKLSRLMEFPDM